MASLVSLSPPKIDSAALVQKQEKLFSILAGMRRVIVAYSGGTDSAYLAWAANQVLGENAVAVTADSASIPNRTSAPPRRSLASAGSGTNISRRMNSTIRIM